MGPGMQLIFKSFILSFSTLWRYLLVMPIVVIPGLIAVCSLLFVPAFVVGGMILAIAVNAPMLVGGLFTIYATFLMSSFICFTIMMGCRSAFAAMGRKNDLDFPRLISKSMAFTTVQMVVWVFIVVVLGGVASAYSLMSGDIGPTFAQSPEVAIQLIMQNPVILSAGFVMILLSLAISALLAVPMAGAAISATPKMGPTDAFIGLGTAFLPIMGVLIVTQVLCTLTGAYLHLSVFIGQLGMAAFQYLTERPIVWMATDQLLLTGGMTLVVVWASCWFYAAAALGWKGYTDEREAALAYKAEVDRFSPDDLRRLREKREQNRLVPGH
jgi:hypothetical protein